MTSSFSASQAWSKDCPNCGAQVSIEPWAMFGDTTCVHCQQSLWFLHLEPRLGVFDRATSAPLRDRVLAFVSSKLGVDPDELAKQQFSFEDLGSDSLDTIELVTKLEQEINQS